MEKLENSPSQRRALISSCRSGRRHLLGTPIFVFQYGRSRDQIVASPFSEVKPSEATATIGLSAMPEAF